MKLVMTLLVRDEADIVEAQLAFHLNAGVDFVIATDNRSQDGTTEILEALRQARVASTSSAKTVSRLSPEGVGHPDGPAGGDEVRRRLDHQ